MTTGGTGVARGRRRRRCRGHPGRRVGRPGSWLCRGSRPGRRRQGALVDQPALKREHSEDEMAVGGASHGAGTISLFPWLSARTWPPPPPSVFFEIFPAAQRVEVRLLQFVGPIPAGGADGGDGGTAWPPNAAASSVIVPDFASPPSPAREGQGPRPFKPRLGIRGRLFGPQLDGPLRKSIG